MAFLIHSVDDGRIPSWEYLPVSAITPKVGMALVQTSGNLAIATGTNKPTYISMCERQTACTAGDLIPVIRVQPDIIFEALNSAAMTSVNRGDKVTLHASNGLAITATTTSGVAEVVEKLDATSSGYTLVRFP